VAAPTPTASAIKAPSASPPTGDGVSWKMRGDSLAERGRLQEAVSCYQRALALQPSFAEAFNNLGNALVQLGRLEEALASYQRVVRLRPTVAETHSNLSKVLLDLQRFDWATRCSTLTACMSRSSATPER
jgi:tetratricopeptide (TPR) repeat protein